MFNTFSKNLFLLVIIITSPRLLADSDKAITLHIEVPFVELHSGPSEGYPVVHIIEKNEDVIVLIKRTSWLKVKDKRGIEGWFHEDDLLGLSQYGQAIKQDGINRSIKIPSMVSCSTSLKNNSR